MPRVKTGESSQSWGGDGRLGVKWREEKKFMRGANTTTVISEMMPVSDPAMPPNEAGRRPSRTHRDGGTRPRRQGSWVSQ